MFVCFIKQLYEVYIFRILLASNKCWQFVNSLYHLEI